MRRNFARSVVFIFLNLAMHAQFYQVRNFNAENGLPSPEVYGVLQDSKGFMWFATDMGVSRYNGYEFKNFSTENGLPDNTVFGFCEDVKGRIWLRSFSGKFSYFLNDSVYTLPCNAVLEKDIKKLAVILVSLHVDGEGTIWAGTTNKVALKITAPYGEKNITWIKIPQDGEYILQLTDKHIVFGGLSSEKVKVTVYNKQVEPIASARLDLTFPILHKHRYFATLLADGTYLCSINNIILKFNSRKITSLALGKATFIALVEDKDHTIISAAYDSIRIHAVDDLASYRTITGLSDKIFTGVLVDHENGLWFTAEGHGVYYIPFRNGRYFTTEHGLPQSKIACIEQKDGYTFTGHLNGTVSIIKNGIQKLISFYSPTIAAASTNRLNCIYAANDGHVYVTNSFNIFKLGTKGLNSHIENKVGGAKKICKSADEKNWLLRDRHIIRCDIKNNFKPIKEIIFDQYVDDIFEDSRGTLWIGAMNGLWRYEKDSLFYVGSKNKLLSSRIINILEDKQGHLWMASRGQGVLVMKDEEVFTIKQEDGLASNMCRNMFIDSLGIVWVGSNNGLSKISVTQETANDLNYTVDVFTKKNGLLTNEVNFILGRGNELWLAHNSGISLFNRTYMKNNSAPPPVYVVHSEINNRSYKQDSLQLRFSENYLKINYVGISYKNPGTLQYKYKMEGLDTSWVYTQYTSAQFQTLNPGNYKFIAYARNDDGYWSSQPAVLYLSVLPAWWQTWAFRISCTLILGFVLYKLVSRRVDKINNRHREKAELQNKISATELKALRAQMNPHFVFNAINSVQHFITSNDPDSSQRYLSKFAKLIRYVVDNSKPNAIPLEKELEALTLFLDLEALRFENRFEYKITVDNKIDVNFVHIPSMLIQPYIENSIWHGIMHKKGIGRIDIKIEQLDSVLKCTIEDNGIGRKRSMELKSGRVEIHKSVGMTITKERLEIINQVNKSELSVSITDLADAEGNAIGTRVELFIPPY